MKIVVYTTIIGGYDTLNEPLVKPDGVDFICFTDRDIKSDVWEIRKVLPLYEDNTRTARKYKVLPHRWFPNYDISIWLDGNKVIEGDILTYVNYLRDSDIALFDHMKCFDKRNCVYQEAMAIFSLGQEPGKVFKDNPHTIKSQMDRYIADGYPQNNGLSFTCGIVRYHNRIIQTMEDWWTEIKHGSKRDQLSFDYAAWKNKLKFVYLPGDGRGDGIITHKSHS
jgi:hypothetical protein|tara:strand:- start:50 stop:718 length:669 start_codon:yes stop_codon:yes gene_type:complete